MLAYIRGILTEMAEDMIVVETHGIGYNLRVPFSLLSELPAVGSEVKIYTYLHVREDALGLFGFVTKDDLNVFKLLIGVNGIGPKGALAILSTITPDDLRFAVLSDDVKVISKAPGIGTKTAQKLIIELKDKLSLEDALEAKSAHVHVQASSAFADSGAKNDAVLALTALGYSTAESLKAVNQSEITDGITAEDLIKQALKKLMTY